MHVLRNIIVFLNVSFIRTQQLLKFNSKRVELYLPVF
ncbi:MAG: hypothetical protein H6Q20_482 [Bacteroidetes bacterium]|jgi:hypothetical protein|nr:hypothetical protein [Bacteroidota bacterium]